jgi:putative salt-induced outer membrane protein YdiY
MRWLKRYLAIIVAVYLLGGGYAAAETQPASPAVDSNYIKEHYPEAYRQIYQQGKADAEAALKKPAAPAPKEAVSSATAPQPKSVLGNWWEKSSLKYSPMPEQWLSHVEGTFDYKEKRGNTESDRYNGSASLMVRKHRFTNTLYYAIDKELSEPTPASPHDSKDTDYRTLQDSLRYDLTDRFYVEGGYMWEKDTANLISGRNIIYAGLGYALIDQERHRLELFLAGGDQEEKFPGAVSSAMDISREEVAAGYLREDYRWNITGRVTYKESFRIIQNLNSSKVFNDDLANLYVTGETNRYRWFLINEIYYSLTDHIDFMTGYKIEYDSNPWPTVRNWDKTLKSGLKFSF